MIPAIWFRIQVINALVAWRRGTKLDDLSGTGRGSRGFEFYWEMLRRTDMIRFGKFEDTWTEKTNSDKFKRVFPIPQNAIDGASNDPGYLVQNPSY